jgi:hypothetical protein
MLVVIEISSIFLAKHYSQTYARVSRQYAEAVKIRPAAPGEPTSVLMVGNSLLLKGLDVDRLRDLTSRTLRIYPVLLEGTGYYDWLYGLRHLFREGARPQVVVVGLEVNTSLENGVWEESPKMLLAARDVFGVASDLGLDRTATSNLLLSHYSTFWEKRSFFRRQILLRTVPHFDELFPFIRSQLTIPQDVEFESIAMPRLRNLRELCRAHGARLILLIPPTPSSEGAVHRMAIASQKVGVEALIPIDPRALSARFYQSDAIHLNSEGAVRFTSAVASDLPNIVGRETLASPD